MVSCFAQAAQTVDKAATLESFIINIDSFEIKDGDKQEGVKSSELLVEVYKSVLSQGKANNGLRAVKDIGKGTYVTKYGGKRFTKEVSLLLVSDTSHIYHLYYILFAGRAEGY